MEESLDEFENLQHAVIHSVLQFAAELIADVLTYQGTRIAAPYLEDSLFQVLSASLEQRGLPSAVIADMFDMSPRTLFRRKARSPAESTSVASLVLDFISERSGMTTIDAICDEFGCIENRTLDSTLHHLRRSNQIVLDGKNVQLTMPVPASENMDDLLIMITAGCRAPISVEELIKALNLPQVVVRRRVRQQLESGQLVADEQGMIVGLGERLSISGDKPSGLLLGVILSLYSLEDTLHRRLSGSAFPDSHFVVKRMFAPQESAELEELNALVAKFETDLEDLSTRISRLEAKNNVGVHVLLACSHPISEHVTLLTDPA